MKKYFTFSETVRKIFAVLTVAVLFIQPVFGALVVSNGNFSDTSGMTAIADGWYNGTPTGWSANGTNEYVIRE